MQNKLCDKEIDINKLNFCNNDMLQSREAGCMTCVKAELKLLIQLSGFKICVRKQERKHINCTAGCLSNAFKI